MTYGDCIYDICVFVCSDYVQLERKRIYSIIVVVVVVVVIEQQY